MLFIEVNVKTAMIVHGFDYNNKEIVEEVNETDFVTKIVAVERIQSISENYLLVSSSHGRVMYWEYEGSLETIRAKLEAADLLLV